MQLALKVEKSPASGLSKSVRNEEFACDEANSQLVSNTERDSKSRQRERAGEVKLRADDTDRSAQAIHNNYVKFLFAVRCTKQNERRPALGEFLGKVKARRVTKASPKQQQMHSESNNNKHT